MGFDMQSGTVTERHHTIDRALECAITLNWNELTLNQAVEGMQVEYRTGPNASLEYLKLWSSASRGHWSLVCEYWMQSSGIHAQGITFNGSYQSEGLTSMLQAIMQNQNAFPKPSLEFLDGLVQVPPPDERRTMAARSEMTNALERMNPHNSAGAATHAMRLAADHPEAPASAQK
jgi:hypothetical protein